MPLRRNLVFFLCAAFCLLAPVFCAKTDLFNRVTRKVTLALAPGGGTVAATRFDIRVSGTNTQCDIGIKATVFSGAGGPDAGTGSGGGGDSGAESGSGTGSGSGGNSSAVVAVARIDPQGLAPTDAELTAALGNLSINGSASPAFFQGAFLILDGSSLEGVLVPGREFGDPGLRGSAFFFWDCLVFFFFFGFFFFTSTSIFSLTRQPPPTPLCWFQLIRPRSPPTAGRFVVTLVPLVAGVSTRVELKPVFQDAVGSLVGGLLAAACVVFAALLAWHIRRKVARLRRKRDNLLAEHAPRSVEMTDLSRGPQGNQQQQGHQQQQRSQQQQHQQPTTAERPDSMLELLDRGVAVVRRRARAAAGERARSDKQARAAGGAVTQL
jgi:hypothetical protein